MTRPCHVKEDLERDILPLRMHVAAMAKGKYSYFDAFPNKEAVHYLKVYREIRNKPVAPPT